MTADEEQAFAALADSTRRQLLSHLANEFPITRQGITKHLDLLASAGQVQSWTQGREKHYSLVPEPLHNVTVWIESLAQQWESRLAQLRTLVESDENI